MFYSLAFPFPILSFCCTFYTHAPTHTLPIKDISFSRVCACVVPHSSASGHGVFESSCKLSPKSLPRLTPAAHYPFYIILFLLLLHAAFDMLAILTPSGVLLVILSVFRFQELHLKTIHTTDLHIWAPFVESSQSILSGSYLFFYFLKCMLACLFT